MQSAEEIQYNKEETGIRQSLERGSGPPTCTYLRISCSASSCAERICVSGTKIDREICQREGELTMLGMLSLIR
jgi:hypothetical protein